MCVGSSVNLCDLLLPTTPSSRQVYKDVYMSIYRGSITAYFKDLQRPGQPSSCSPAIVKQKATYRTDKCWFMLRCYFFHLRSFHTCCFSFMGSNMIRDRNQYLENLQHLFSSSDFQRNAIATGFKIKVVTLQEQACKGLHLSHKRQTTHESPLMWHETETCSWLPCQTVAADWITNKQHKLVCL